MDEGGRKATGLNLFNPDGLANIRSQTIAIEASRKPAFIHAPRSGTAMPRLNPGCSGVPANATLVGHQRAIGRCIFEAASAFQMEANLTNDMTIADALVAGESKLLWDDIPPLNRKDRRARAAQTRTRTPRTCEWCVVRASVEQATAGHAPGKKTDRRDYWACGGPRAGEPALTYNDADLGAGSNSECRSVLEVIQGSSFRAGYGASSGNGCDDRLGEADHVLLLAAMLEPIKGDPSRLCCSG
jgi:hypothetical protein